MRKVAVIGMGHVGATAAFILFTHGVADELVLLDKNETKCRAEWGDLRDTLAETTSTSTSSGATGKSWRTLT